MRILHLSDSDGTSGASRAAYRMHGALQAAGVDSHMLVEYKRTRDPTVHAACGFRGFPGRLLFAIRGEIDLARLRCYPQRMRLPWVRGELPRGLPALVHRLAPDIVHLHWLGTLGPVHELPELNVPTLWSLHDVHAFTGGCCYPGDCRKFTVACGSCPQLGSRNPDDLSARLLEHKRQCWAHWPVRVVGLTRWMTDLSRASVVLGHKKHDTVLNGVHTDELKPVAQQVARQALALPLDRPLVLFGAASLADARKGGDLLFEALKCLATHPQPKTSRPEVVVFGRHDASLDRDMPFPVHSLGFINEPKRLTLAYSAADAIVVPSREDNCPQVPIEALACGTPVVAFNATGLQDLVEDGVTGRLARPFDPTDLARAIDDLLQMPEQDRLEMRDRCRRTAVERFDIQRVARDYQALYH